MEPRWCAVYGWLPARLCRGIAIPFKWVGPFLGSKILYDHIFSQNEPGQTTVRFTVDVAGGPGTLIGGIFGRIYRKNLDHAVPLLVREIEAIAGPKA
jgi:hypothetical protein